MKDYEKEFITEFDKLVNDIIKQAVDNLNFAADAVKSSHDKKHKIYQEQLKQIEKREGE